MNLHYQGTGLITRSALQKKDDPAPETTEAHNQPTPVAKCTGSLQSRSSQEQPNKKKLRKYEGMVASPMNLAAIDASLTNANS
jgi:hypothetical protein